jgi:hypothetical protein
MDDRTKDHISERAAEPTPDHTDASIERERMRSLSTSSQGHLCPRRSKAAAQRSIHSGAKIARPSLVWPMQNTESRSVRISRECHPGHQGRTPGTRAWSAGCGRWRVVRREHGYTRGYSPVRRLLLPHPPAARPQAVPSRSGAAGRDQSRKEPADQITTRCTNGQSCGGRSRLDVVSGFPDDYSHVAA